MDLTTYVLLVHPQAAAPFEPKAPAEHARPWIPVWVQDAAGRYGPAAVRIAVEAAIRYAS